MERLDEKIDREQRTLKAWSMIQGVKNFFVNFGQDVSNYSNKKLSEIQEYIEDKERKRAENDKMQGIFEKYVSMHNESKIGTVEFEELEGNDGFRTIVYTKHGPVIKTVILDNMTAGAVVGFSSNNRRLRYGWCDAMQDSPTCKVSYEGYCLDSNSDTGYDHYYYANITRDGSIHRETSYRGIITTSEGIQSTQKTGCEYVKPYYGFVRKDNGKFVKVYQEIPVYRSKGIYPFEDLKATFDKAYQRAIGEVEMETDN